MMGSLQAAKWLLRHSTVSALMPRSASAQRHGTIDVLVNNAGKAAWTGQGPTDGTPERWQQLRASAACRESRRGVHEFCNTLHLNCRRPQVGYEGCAVLAANSITRTRAQQTRMET